MAWIVALDVVVGVLALSVIGWLAWRLVVKPGLRLTAALAAVGTQLTDAVERVGTDLGDAVSALGARVSEALELVTAGADTPPTHPDGPRQTYIAR